MNSGYELRIEMYHVTVTVFWVMLFPYWHPALSRVRTACCWELPIPFPLLNPYMWLFLWAIDISFLPPSLLPFFTLSFPLFFPSYPFFFFLSPSLPSSLLLFFSLFLPIFLSAFFFCSESFSESTFSVMGSLTIPDQENLQNSYCLPCIQLITHNCFYVRV